MSPLFTVITHHPPARPFAGPGAGFACRRRLFPGFRGDRGGRRAGCGHGPGLRPNGCGRRTVPQAQRQSLPAESRNVGLRLAKGEWILYLDDDDTHEPFCLANFAAAIQAHGQGSSGAVHRPGSGARAPLAQRRGVSAQETVPLGHVPLAQAYLKNFIPNNVNWPSRRSVLEGIGWTPTWPRWRIGTSCGGDGPGHARPLPGAAPSCIKDENTRPPTAAAPEARDQRHRGAGLPAHLPPLARAS